jgi:hypothetical protein
MSGKRPAEAGLFCDILAGLAFEPSFVHLSFRLKSAFARSDPPKYALRPATKGSGGLAVTSCAKSIIWSAIDGKSDLV